MGQVSGFAFHVVGAGRGGTSLVAALIDTHPKCAVHFEEFSTTYLMGQGATEAERLLLPAERTRDRIAHFLRACEAKAALEPETIWGHKTTTEHIAGLAKAGTGTSMAEDKHALGSFVESVAQIPTIFILRDGRTCVRSKVQRTGQSTELAVKRWLYSLQVLKAFEQRLWCLLVIKYEDLVTLPEETMRTVLAFLGVEYDPCVLSGTTNIKMMEVYRSNGFDRSKLEFDDDGTQDWVEQIRPQLIVNGYL